MKKTLMLLLCVLLLLPLVSACHSEPMSVSGETSNTEHPTASTALQMQDTLQTELIEVLPWNSGRAEITDGYFTAETENGFYLEFGAMLYYADKSDMSNWILVCPDPECEHESGSRDCDAFIGGTFYVKDDRIYHLARKSWDLEQWAQVDGFGTPFVASMALDGTDKRVEHVFGTPEGSMRSDEYSGAMFLTKDFAIESTSGLNANGAYDTWLMVVDQGGEYPLYVGEKEDDKAYLSPWRRRNMLFGDVVFYSWLMDEGANKAFKLEGRELTSVDLGELECEGGYLSGDILWVFRPDDGYYSVNLTTKEEIKMADAQLEHSTAYIALPNCILESTILGTTSKENRTVGQNHSLRYFDGVQWWDVELPEELRNIGTDSFLELSAVGSDRILFVFADGPVQERQLITYQIMLGTEKPELEKLGELYWNFSIE